jgi:NADH:ubiquinone oxidoreductase subunit 3 (subunit A)
MLPFISRISSDGVLFSTYQVFPSTYRWTFGPWKGEIVEFSWLNLTIILGLVFGTLLGALPLIGAKLLAPRSTARELDLPYECGITPHGPARVRFGINYYFYALLFLAFDVDVLYLFPVAAVYPTSPGWAIFWELIVFIGVLALAVVYFWRKGVFTWPRKISF